MCVTCLPTNGCLLEIKPGLIFVRSNRDTVTTTCCVSEQIRISMFKNTHTTFCHKCNFTIRWNVLDSATIVNVGAESLQEVTQFNSQDHWHQFAIDGVVLFNTIINNYLCRGSNVWSMTLGSTSRFGLGSFRTTDIWGTSVSYIRVRRLNLQRES